MHNDSAMLLESEVQELARSIGSRAQVLDKGDVRYVGDETYLSVEMIRFLCAFARKHKRT
jgi:hypothetical protein